MWTTESRRTGKDRDIYCNIYVPSSTGVIALQDISCPHNVPGKMPCTAAGRWHHWHNANFISYVLDQFDLYQRVLYPHGVFFAMQTSSNSDKTKELYNLPVQGNDTGEHVGARLLWINAKHLLQMTSGPGRTGKGG